MLYSNSKSIVITSINSPTISCKRYSELSDWRLIVVGDVNTPKNWSLPNTQFISINDQISQLAKVLPHNSYSRKNLGYSAAIENGAEWIIDTDDDTSPILMPDDYLVPEYTAKVLKSKTGFVNSYKIYGYGTVWPRGFPLCNIHHTPEIHPARTIFTPIRQFMISGDTDVDAIYRLTHSDLDFHWDDDKPYNVDQTCYCPCNSQAVLWHHSVFPLLFIPATTTMRACDIVRGYVAQRCLRAQNYGLGLGPALFSQNRNPHDYMSDFKDEIPIYLYIQDLASKLDGTRLEGDLYKDLKACYKTIVHYFSGKGLLEERELEILDAWIDTIKEIEFRG